MSNVNMRIKPKLTRILSIAKGMITKNQEQFFIFIVRLRLKLIFIILPFNTYFTIVTKVFYRTKSLMRFGDLKDFLCRSYIYISFFFLILFFTLFSIFLCTSPHFITKIVLINGASRVRCTRELHK